MNTSSYVVVTGSAGFIGSRLMSALRAGGVHATGVDIRGGLGATALDIRHPIGPGVFDGVDTVVHLAALAGVRPSMLDPRTYADTNVLGTANVLAAAAQAGVRRVVVASSSSVYGECPRPAREGRRLEPLSPYARTKSAAEALVASYADCLEIVVVRPFTVYGPGQRTDMLIGKLLRGEAVTLWPFIRDFTFVDDVVAALVGSIGARKRERVDVYNLGSGRPVTAAELLTTIAEVTGFLPDVEVCEPRPFEPRQTWADPRQARTHLGMPEPTSLLDGIASQAAEMAVVAA